VLQVASYTGFQIGDQVLSEKNLAIGSTDYV
jgi:hypothetical protein